MLLKALFSVVVVGISFGAQAKGIDFPIANDARNIEVQSIKYGKIYLGSNRVRTSELCGSDSPTLCGWTTEPVYGTGYLIEIYYGSDERSNAERLKQYDGENFNLTGNAIKEIKLTAGEWQPGVTKISIALSDRVVQEPVFAYCTYYNPQDEQIHKLENCDESEIVGYKTVNQKFLTISPK